MTDTTQVAEKTTDILDIALENSDFRRVIDTGEREQVVVMSLKVGEEIGAEVHPITDQVFIIIDGMGEAVIDDESRSFDEGDLLFVRAGKRHNIINRGDTPLRLITIYAPPAHMPGTIHHTKAQADAEEEA